MAQGIHKRTSTIPKHQIKRRKTNHLNCKLQEMKKMLFQNKNANFDFLPNKTIFQQTKTAILEENCGLLKKEEDIKNQLNSIRFMEKDKINFSKKISIQTAEDMSIVNQNQDRVQRAKIKILYNTVQYQGVFDGHGNKGGDIAEYCKKHLHILLEKQCNEILDESKFQDTLSIHENIALCMQAAAQRMHEMCEQKFPGIPTDGTTANFSILIGDTIFTANLGDSSSILVGKNFPALRTSVSQNAKHPLRKESHVMKLFKKLVEKECEKHERFYCPENIHFSFKDYIHKIVINSGRTLEGLQPLGGLGHARGISFFIPQITWYKPPQGSYLISGSDGCISTEVCEAIEFKKKYELDDNFKKYIGDILKRFEPESPLMTYIDLIKKGVLKFDKGNPVKSIQEIHKYRYIENPKGPTEEDKKELLEYFLLDELNNILNNIIPESLTSLDNINLLIVKHHKGNSLQALAKHITEHGKELFTKSYGPKEFDDASVAITQID